MKKNIQILSLLLVLSSISLQAQKEFTGTITYTYKLEGENAEMMAAFMPQAMLVTYGDQGIITTMQGGMVANMMGKIVVDTKNDRSFIVKEGEQTVYMMDLDDAEEATEGMVASDVKSFDETKEIMGYTCSKFQTETTDANGQTLKQIIWATKELKFKDYKFSGKAKELMSNAYNEKLGNVVPMEAQIYMPAQDMTLILTVTNIDKTKIPSSSFDIPKGYAQKDISEMFGQ